MAYLFQVSFYDICGHTEGLLWYSSNMSHANMTTGLPPLDRCVLQTVPDDTLKGRVTEVHYQKTSCRVCAGAVHVKLNLIPEARKHERCLLWRSYVDQCRYAQNREVDRNTSMLAYLNRKRVQFERELQSSAEMKHGQVSEEIFDNLDQIQASIESIHNRQNWFRSAASNLYMQLYDGVPLLEKIHILSPGWDTDLFAVVDLHTIEPDEECSICLTDLNTIRGRVRRLPCGHVYHTTCVRSWFEDMGSNTCPYCRHAYSIVEPPRLR